MKAVRHAIAQAVPIVAPGLTTRDGNEFRLAGPLAGSEMKRFDAITNRATTPLLPDRRPSGSNPFHPITFFCLSTSEDYEKSVVPILWTKSLWK